MIKHKVLNNICSDYIKRQDVLDAIWPVDPENDGYDGGTVVLQNLELTSADVESIVSEIPAADVRPVVRGRFVHDGPRFVGGVDWWHCSNCGSLVSGVETRFAFCPHCGADMRGGGEE